MMRPLGPQDLSIAARALMAVPSRDRIDFADQLVVEAEVADKFRKRVGRAHVLHGNGSLEAAARAHPLAPTQRFGNREFLSCMEMVIASVRRKAPIEEFVE